MRHPINRLSPKHFLQKTNKWYFLFTKGIGYGKKISPEKFIQKNVIKLVFPLNVIGVVPERDNKYPFQITFLLDALKKQCHDNGFHTLSILYLIFQKMTISISLKQMYPIIPDTSNSLRPL